MRTFTSIPLSIRVVITLSTKFAAKVGFLVFSFNFFPCMLAKSLSLP